MDLAWISIAALLVVVGVSCTSRGNPGVVGIVLAWLIAVYAAPAFHQTLGVRSLWGAFPGELFLTLVGVGLLFGQAEANGTLLRVARWAQRLCRGRVGLLPVVFFALCLVLGTFGAGNIAVAGLIAPVAMAAASRSGIPPLLMAIMVGHGAVASTLSPFTAGGVVADQILRDIGLTGVEWRMYAYNAVANLTVGVIGYLALGGWKLLRARTTGGVLDAPTAEADGNDDGMTSAHVVTLVIVGTVVVAVVVGKAHIGMTAFAAAAVMTVFGLADERAAFQRVPWSVIVMVCGVSVLTGLLEKTGGTERFASLIAAASSPSSLTGVTAFATGIISVYSSTTGVVLPAFLPMVKNLAQLHPTVSPIGLASSVIVGGNLVDVSPLSTIGALCIAASLEADRRQLFNRLLAWGMGMSVVGAVLCWALFGPR